MHYVYELRDPRNGKAFYVGKGVGDRAYQHQREVVNGTARSNPAKISKIKEILDAGLQVEVVIIAEYRLEEDALDHEYHAISADVTLTNIMPGGGCLSPLAVAASMHGRSVRLLEKLKAIKAAREDRLKRMAGGSNPVKSLVKFRNATRRPVPAREMEQVKEWLAATAPTQVRLPKQKYCKKDVIYVKADKEFRALVERIALAEELVAANFSELKKQRQAAQKARAQAA